MGKYMPTNPAWARNDIGDGTMTDYTSLEKIRLQKIEELALRTTKEIRHMLFTLRPLILESQGLTAALHAMAEKMRETYSQNVIINVDERIL